MKRQIISEPEGMTRDLTTDDDLLILASDGLHNSYSPSYLVRRVNELRRMGYTLGNAAQTIVDECLDLENVEKAANDNVTLIIVSLPHYLADYRSRSRANTPLQLQLCRQSSVGHENYYDSSSQYKNCNDLAVENHSLLQHSSENGGRFSGVSGNASQVSTSNAIVNPFALNMSNPSSQTSSPY